MLTWSDVIGCHTVAASVLLPYVVLCRTVYHRIWDVARSGDITFVSAMENGTHSMVHAFDRNGVLLTSIMNHDDDDDDDDDSQVCACQAGPDVFSFAIMFPPGT